MQDRWGKRAADIVAGTLVALALIPVVVLLALLSAASLRTVRPLFVQRRIGRGGRPIPVVKIRTLPCSTDRYAAKADLAEIAVPRLMGSLRRLHLDELPQLFLVPLGYLSLVGPRPEMPFLHDEMDQAFAAARVTVRPGCTGLWQVGRRSVGMIGDAPEFDLFYLRHASLRLDLWIMWRTFRMLVGRPRHADLHEVPSWALRDDVPVEAASVGDGASTDVATGLGTVTS